MKKFASLMTAASLAALAPLPLAALDMNVIEYMAKDLKRDGSAKKYNGAIASCLAGNGDPAKTAEYFAQGEWDVTPQPEMGIIEFSGPDENVYAMAADDGSFCMASAEDQGFISAMGKLQVMGLAAGLKFKEVPHPTGCLTFEMENGLTGQITSSGNDPVCEDENTSSVRFEWAAAQ